MTWAPEPILFPSRLSRGYVTHSGGGGEVPEEPRQEKVGIRLGLEGWAGFEEEGEEGAI